MEVKLKVNVGNNAGQELKIVGPKFFVGRSDDCQLRPRSDLVSRHHCVLIVEEGYVSVRDFGSKNGTYVNGSRVANEVELKTGDQLKIGPLEFEVVIVPTLAPAKKKPKVESAKEAAVRTAESNSAYEMDVGDWITAEKKSDVNETRIADTQAKLAGETESIDVAEVREEVRQSEAPKPAGPGKLPAAPATADSKSAASEVLNKFFRRR